MKHAQTYFLAIVAMAMLVPVTGCGEQRSENERIESAYNDYKAGKYRSAFIELKNVLQANPGNKDARVLLGMTSLKMGDAPSAAKELERARDLGASPDEYYVPSLQARLMLGEYKQIIDEFDVTRIENQENRQIAKIYYGNAFFRDGQVSAAEGEYRAVINSATAAEPLRRAHMGLAEVAQSRGELENAIAMASKSVEYGPHSIESTVFLGQLLLADEQFELAREQFIRVRQSASSSSTERFSAAAGEIDAALNLGDIEEAKHAGNRLFQLSPDHPITGFSLARVALASGEKDAAYDFLQGVLSRYPQYRQAQTLQGMLSLERKEYEQAEMFLGSVVTAQPGNLEARKLLAETRLLMNKPEAAAKVLQEGIDAGVSDPQMISMLGRATMQQGDKDTAIVQLESSLASNPDDSNLQIALAAAYLSNGQPARAIETIKSGSGETSTRAELLLLLAAVQKKDEAGARQQAEAIARKWPDDLTVNNLLGGWYYSLGEYDTARGFFDTILRSSPNDINALTTLGRIDVVQKNFEQARNRYLEFLKREPDNLSGLLSLAYIYQAEGDQENALKAVERAHNSDPTAVTPAILLSRFRLLNRDYRNALQFANIAVVSNPRSVSALMAKGKALTALGKAGEALESYSAASEIEPDNRIVLHSRAQAELQVKKFAQARATYEKIWNDDSDDFQAARNLVVLEVRAGYNAKAIKTMDALKASGKQPALVAEIEGDLHRENKDIEKALQFYRKAYELQPSRTVAVKVHRIVDAGDQDASAPLLDWLEQAPQDATVRILLGQYYQKTSKNNRAIDAYNKVLEQRPDVPMVLNNLALLYFEHGGSEQKTEAVNLARRAWEFVPNSPQIADTYGWVLFRSGQLKEGTKILAEAESIAARIGSSSLNDITYHHAVALNEQGDSDAARLRLQKMLSTNDSFSSRADAEKLLESLQR